jgi:hypothetical protein
METEDGKGASFFVKLRQKTNLSCCLSQFHDVIAIFNKQNYFSLKT